MILVDRSLTNRLELTLSAILAYTQHFLLLLNRNVRLTKLTVDQPVVSSPNSPLPRNTPLPAHRGF
jgi:hypothetical protein